MKHKKLLGGSMIVTLICDAIVGILFNIQTIKPIVDQDAVEQKTIAEKKWIRQALGDADPGAGNTGFMYVMCYPHPATDPIETTYSVNLSNDSTVGGAYEFSDSTNTEMTNETPHGNAFDFVVKVRVNNSDGYNTSGAQWENDWVRSNITVDFDYLSDLNDVAMSEVVIGTEGTTYRWYHYVVNNSGSGYTLSKGELFNITSWTFDVYE